MRQLVCAEPAACPFYWDCVSSVGPGTLSRCNRLTLRYGVVVPASPNIRSSAARGIRMRRPILTWGISLRVTAS